MAKLAEGDKAPSFRLPNQDGKITSLADFAGRHVVVYFYPRDDTPGCTKEACQFSDLLSEFSGLETEVLGISADKGESHQRFRKKYGLNIDLLTDEGHKVMESYGAWGEKMNYGKTTMGVIRSTFIVGPKGKIERAWYSVKADGHAAKVLAALES